VSDPAREKKAVALKYESGKDKAPRVVAQGRRAKAERIIEEARKAGVPMKEDPDLTEVLMKLALYEEIPSELYVAIAEVLAWVYRVNHDYEPPGGGSPRGSGNQTEP